MKVLCKSKIFATVIYPDSAPQNWKEVLDSMDVFTSVSPLHIGEDNRANHYHVMFCFPNSVSTNEVVFYINQVGGLGVIPVSSVQDYVDYCLDK